MVALDVGKFGSREDDNMREATDKFDVSSLARLMPRLEADDSLVELFGANVYAIGGRVRDALVGHFHGRDVPEPKDLDYVVTGHTLLQVVESFEAKGIKVDAVGASFAVLKVAIGALTVDVALPRRERSTGFGHRDFEVSFGPEISIEDDAGRRDFTINALGLHLAEWRIIAPARALDDLRRGVIRAITDFSFDDDPLRMLRAVQFASRLAFGIDPDTFAQIRARAPAIRHCSPERVRDELVKLLEKSSRPSVGMNLLRDSGLLACIIPELMEAVGVVQNRYHAFDVWNHIMAALDASAAAGHDFVTLMAVLLHDVGKPRSAAPRADGHGNTFYGHEIVGAEMAVGILRRLRFPENVVENVRLAVREHMYATRDSGGGQLSDAVLRRFIRRLGPENVDRQFAVRYADVQGKGDQPSSTDHDHNDIFERRVRQLLSEKPPISVKQLPITGQDVIALLVEHGVHPAGYRGGKDVGLILERLLEMVIENPGNAERDRLLAHAKDMVRSMREGIV
jgi:tRNA nucleotidyltransferase (CCA-adding enzyme)